MEQASNILSNFVNELKFLKIAENLKKELRHSWLSNGRHESVAEHSWRLSLMVIRYAHKLDQKIEIEKALQLALIHDLAEAKVGDIPIFNCVTAASKKQKYENEHQAMLEIKAMIADKNGDEIYNLWMEYEKQETPESKFVKALDKLEALIQHNEADLDTWTEQEKRILFQYKWAKKYCEYDVFLSNFCQAIIQAGINKLIEAGENIEDIKRQAEQEEKSESLSALTYY